MAEVIAEGYEYLQGLCPECSIWRTMGLDRLTVSPGKIDLKTLTLEKLVGRLRCHKCGSPMQDVEPWRQSDATGDTVPKFGAQRRRPPLRPK